MKDNLSVYNIVEGCMFEIKQMIVGCLTSFLNFKQNL